jgi:putative proteasome-type protease
MLLADGLVLMADTRTNAGVDNISTYRKLHVFDTDAYSVVIASAGSLSTTQEALSLLGEGVLNPDSGELETLGTAPNMFRAAQMIGRALHKARADVGSVLEGETQVSADVTFLVGGRIGGERLRLFLIYGPGNFIECGADTPYYQIGETKYGKPILDRQLRCDTPIAEAMKIGLISFNSTMRSNLAVGMPIDLAVLRPVERGIAVQHRITAQDPYWQSLDELWSNALRQAQAAIPPPPYFGG